MNLFFDLDGTLINSAHRHYVVLLNAISKAGINADICEDYFLLYKREGRSTKQFLIDELHISNEKAIDINTSWIKHIEDDRYLQLDYLFPDAAPVLVNLIKSNDIYYLTARNNKNGVEDEIERLGIANLCKKLFIVNPAEGSSEKSLIIRKYMHDDCIMIGDTEADYNAANIVGIKSYILNRGFRSQNYWNNKGISSYPDLTKFVEFVRKEDKE